MSRMWGAQDRDRAELSKRDRRGTGLAGPTLATMTPLAAFGALAVGAMLLLYAFESRSPWFILTFAGACLASSAYGFLQGVWPFGVVEFGGAGWPRAAGGPAAAPSADWCNPPGLRRRLRANSSTPTRGRAVCMERTDRGT